MDINCIINILEFTKLYKYYIIIKSIEMNLVNKKMNLLIILFYYMIIIMVLYYTIIKSTKKIIAQITKLKNKRDKYK